MLPARAGSIKVGLRVIAEGVESPEQLAFLKQHDCNLAQGYWISHPLAENACLDFLLANRAARRGQFRAT